MYISIIIIDIKHGCSIKNLKRMLISVHYFHLGVFGFYVMSGWNLDIPCRILWVNWLLGNMITLNIQDSLTRSFFTDIFFVSDDNLVV